MINSKHGGLNILEFIRPRVEVVLVAATLGWTAHFVFWLLCGSGYQSVQPIAYEYTTRLLLSSPVTAAEVSEKIRAQGYLSLVEQHRLLSMLTR